MDFESFEKSLRSSPTERWRAFQEEIVPWWLQNDPQFQVTQYWPWDTWPDRRRHDYILRDIGIDGVARTESGALWAIQIKYSDTPEKNLSWSELSTFFGLAARPTKRVFDRRVVVTNTWSPGPNARAVFRSNADTLWLGRQNLLDAPLDWARLAHRRSASRPPPRPRRHQVAAVAAIEESLVTGGRAQIHMPCGTGKTLVALWAHERLCSRRTLVLLPTLSLARQVLREWVSNRTELFAFLTVCSDATVAGNDALVEVASELGTVTTTDPAEVAAFLRRREDRSCVVFSTYQSSPQVAAAQRAKGVPSFDLVICDEAHKTAGWQGGTFATVLHEKKIRAERRLFMTATPRIYGRKIKDEAGNGDFRAYSMDDERVFGRVAFAMSFAEAIRNRPAPLLCDYRVVAMVVSDADVERAIKDRVLLHIDDHIADAEALATRVALGKERRRKRGRRNR